jgi:hypothetical protein
MKAITKFLLLITIVLLFIPGVALAAEPGGGFISVLPDQFVFGDNYILDRGQTLSGNLWVFGGNVDLREESRVTGSLMVFGGNIRVDGTVDGDINAAGGNVTLQSQALVRGNITLMGGSINRHASARVEGDVFDNPSGPFSYTLPRGVRLPRFDVVLHPFVDFLTFLFQAFLTAALAVLVAMFLPVQTQRVAQTAIRQPFVAGGLGLLTVIVLPLALLIMTITIILIPAALLLILLIGIILLFGWIALGLELGKRMADLFKTEWALPVAAGLGTLTLSIVVGGIGKYLWCIGWILPTLVALVGFGSVLLTRFGTQHYPPGGALIPAAPAPPAPSGSSEVQVYDQSQPLAEDLGEDEIVYPTGQDDEETRPDE